MKKRVFFGIGFINLEGIKNFLEGINNPEILRIFKNHEFLRITNFLRITIFEITTRLISILFNNIYSTLKNYLQVLCL